MKRKLGAILLAAVVGFGGTVVGAQAAFADDTGSMPSGCSIQSNAPSLSGVYVAYSGSGYCNAPYINSFVIRLVHNYDGLPDVRVKSKTQSPAAAPNYSLSDTTCDNGGTTQYYTETGYYRYGENGGDVIRSSSTRTLTHC